MPLFYLSYALESPVPPSPQGSDGVRLLGRWHAVGGERGFCICEAPRADVLDKWLASWGTVVLVTPVVDDNEAREILLGTSPPYQVVHQARTAADNESLYVIRYRFFEDKREEGTHAFANMPPTEDTCGNTLIGRWHDLGTGSGLAVCLSTSAVYLQRWAAQWTKLCDCAITPVVEPTPVVAPESPTRRAWWWSSR